MEAVTCHRIPQDFILIWSLFTIHILVPCALGFSLGVTKWKNRKRWVSIIQTSQTQHIYRWKQNKRNTRTAQIVHYSLLVWNYNLPCCLINDIRFHLFISFTAMLLFSTVFFITAILPLSLTVRLHKNHRYKESVSCLMRRWITDHILSESTIGNTRISVYTDVLNS